MIARKHLLCLIPLLLFCWAAPVSADVYGFDPVPGSTFHRGNWAFYGVDAVPDGHTTHPGLIGYGFDGVPRARHPHVDEHHHARLLETLQRFATAFESNTEVRTSR